MNSKVRLAKRFPLRKEHPIGIERVLGRVETELALRKASAVFPKSPRGSLTALDMSHQKQSFGPA